MLRTMSFPKTVLVFRRYSFKILRYLLVSTSLKNFCWQVNIYIYSYLLWNIRVWNIRVCFDNVRWKIRFLKSLKDLKLEDFKIFLFYLISKVSWFISDFIICWNETLIICWNETLVSWPNTLLIINSCKTWMVFVLLNYP